MVGTSFHSVVGLVFLLPPSSPTTDMPLRLLVGLQGVLNHLELGYRRIGQRDRDTVQLFQTRNEISARSGDSSTKK
ncbi:MAG: hypothetical protein C4326_13155 [Ignavibacteria bacterium]